MKGSESTSSTDKTLGQSDLAAPADAPASESPFRSLRVIDWAHLCLVGLLSPLLLFPRVEWMAVVLVLPLVWIARFFIDRRLVEPTPLNRLLFPLLGMVGVSVWATFDVEFSLGKIAGTLLGVFVLLVVVQVVRNPRLLVLGVGFWVLGGVGMALFSLVSTKWKASVPLVSSIGRLFPPRINLPGVEDAFNPNAIGGTMILFVSVLLLLGSWVFLNQRGRGWRLEAGDWRAGRGLEAGRPPTSDLQPPSVNRQPSADDQPPAVDCRPSTVDQSRAVSRQPSTVNLDSPQNPTPNTQHPPPAVNRQPTTDNLESPQQPTPNTQNPSGIVNRQSSIVNRGNCSSLLGLAVFVSGLLTLFVLVLSQSRGAYAGFAASVALLLVIRFKWVRWGALGLTVVGFLLVGGSWWQSGASLESFQGGEAIDEATGEIGLEARMEIWNRATYGIQDFPFTGMGMNNFRKVVHLLYPLFLVAPDTDIASAHNQILQTALDLGIPGLIAYLGIWFAVARMIWLIGRRSKNTFYRVTAVGLGAGLFAQFVHLQVDSIPLGAKVGIFWWIAVALVAAVFKLEFGFPEIGKWRSFEVVLIWVLLSLVSISFVGDHPYWALTIAIVGAAYLGYLTTYLPEEV